VVLVAQAIKDKISEHNEEAILWDGLDGAIIGVSSDGRVVYDIRKIISELQEQGMREEEAIEWFDFNIESAYVGEYTPIHIYTV
jgi:hypothetical protein